MGVAPEATVQELVLGCRLHRLVSFAAIFIVLLDIFITIGCATRAPDGSSPRGYEQMLAFGHRLSPFLYCHTRNFLFFQSSPRAFGQKLVFDQRLQKYSNDLSCRHSFFFYFSCRQTFPCQNLFTSMNSRNFSALWVHF